MNTELLKSKLLEAAFNGSLTHADTSKWNKFSLGEIFFMKAGTNISASQIHDEQSDEYPYPCYGGNDIRGYVSIYNKEGSFPIIGRQGALCGNVKYATGRFYATEHAVVVQNIKNVDSKWAYHALTFLNLNQYATSTAQPGLSVKRIEQVQLCLPPFAEQKQIVSTLEEGFAAIDAIADAKENLATTAELLRSKILQAAIQGRLIPQDPKDEPASVLLEKIREEKKRLVKEGKLKKKDLEEKPISEEEIPFEIPESWEWCRFGSIISLLSGRDLDPKDYNDQNNGIPYITGASCIDNGLLKVNRWTTNPVVISSYGDILFSCKGTIGKIAINTVGDCHIARQIMAIKPIIIESDYVRYFMEALTTSLKNSAQSMIPGISREDILDATFPLPPLAEQERIVAKIDELFGEIDKLTK